MQRHGLPDAVAWQRHIDERHVQGTSDALGYVVLDFFELRNLPVKSFRPELRSVRSIDKLRVDAEGIHDSAHATLQDVAHR